MIAFLKKLHKSVKYLENANQALAEEYSRAVDETTMRFKERLITATDRIAELTQDTVRLDEKLRVIHEERLDNIEGRWTEKCKACREHLEVERSRLRSMQDTISKYISEFTIVFNKLFKHATFVGAAHDTILTSAAQVKASQDMLVGIQKEAQIIINKVEPLLQITGEGISDAKRRATGSMHRDQSESATVNEGDRTGSKTIPGEDRKPSRRNRQESNS